MAPRIRDITCVLLLTIPTLPAEAQPSSCAAPSATGADTTKRRRQSDALGDKGIELLEAGRAAEALGYFLQSKDLVETDSNTMNAAICLDTLGRYDEAIDMYELVVGRFASLLTRANSENIVPRINRLRTLVATIIIDANVDGFSVTVDGQLRKHLANPHRLHVLPGKHVLRITRNDFQPYEENLDVSACDERRLGVELTPLRAWLLIKESDPALTGSEVYIDGQYAGVTPLSQQVSAGPKVVWTRAGTRGSAPIMVTPEDRMIKQVDVRSGPLGGSVRIEVEPNDASLFIGGARMPGPRFEGRLPTGDYDIRATDEGFRAATRRIRISSDTRQQVVRIALEKDPTHAKWIRPSLGRPWISAFAGYAVGPSLGSGAEDACHSGDCKNQFPPMGVYAGLRGGYELSFGLSAELTAGILFAGTTLQRRAANKADPNVTYALRDDLFLWGPVVLAGASYRRSVVSFADLVLRLGAGLFVVRSADRISGSALGYGSSVPVDFRDQSVITSPRERRESPPRSGEMGSADVAFGPKTGALCPHADGRTSPGRRRDRRTDIQGAR